MFREFSSCGATTIGSSGKIFVGIVGNARLTAGTPSDSSPYLVDRQHWISWHRSIDGSGRLVAVSNSQRDLFGENKVITVTDNFSERARNALIKLCNDRLADAVDLQLQCKHAYWNTKDSGLATVRELFDELNESLECYIDRIAERAVELGGVANSTERIEATWSHVLCSPDAICRNHAQTIATALASFGELVRKTIDTAKELSDFVSAEMFTEILEGVDNWRRSLAAV